MNKKLIGFALLLTLAVTLGACGPKEETPAPDGTPAGSPTTTP